MIRPRLYLSHDAKLDWLIALEYGRVDEGQPPDCWEGVAETVGLLHDANEDGPVVGFKVLRFSKLDLEDPENAGVWEGPRFDAPVLGLVDASVGEIALAARALFGRRSSINRFMFDAAVDAEGRKALGRWLACLQAGESMAHFGLGYTLWELGRHHEAYRHLRHYTEIAPCQSWAWCWRGKAAESLGEAAEAWTAYTRAIELTAGGGEDTDAPELLARLRRE